MYVTRAPTLLTCPIKFVKLHKLNCQRESEERLETLRKQLTANVACTLAKKVSQIKFQYGKNYVWQRKLKHFRCG